MAAAMGNIVREQNKEKRKPGRRSKRSKRSGGHSVEEGEVEEETAVTNTVLVLGPRGSLRIYPPYGKVGIYSNSLERKLSFKFLEDLKIILKNPISGIILYQQFYHLWIKKC